MGFFDKAKSLFSKLSPFSTKDGKKVVEELLKHPINLRRAINLGDFKDGTICYFEYDPKDKNQIWDYKPLVLVLGVSNSYVLGCNFHWINMKERLRLIEYILKINKKGSTINMPLEFTYKQLKPFLKKPEYEKCIHLYIRKRMSTNGVIIDPKYLLDVARLKIQHFQGPAKAFKKWQQQDLEF
jgi:hypothetical protein